MTTSYVHKQAYKEVIEDGHPILIVSASDIARVLRNSSIMSGDIDDWLASLDEDDHRREKRLIAYQKALQKMIPISLKNGLLF